MIKLLLAISLTFAPMPTWAQQSVGSFDQISSHDAYKNFIKNTGAEKNASNITESAAITTRTTTTPLEGVGSFSIDATSSGQTVKFTASTLSDYLKGQNCEAKFVFSGDATLYKAYVEQSSNKLSADLQLTNETNARTVSINFPCGTTVTDVRPVIESTSASAAAIKVDKIYIGLSTNIGSVAQAEIVAKFSRTSSNQTIGVATETKIQYNGEEYDPYGWYDNSTNYRLTVQKEGKYSVSVNQYYSGLTASEFYYIMVKKNGTDVCNLFSSTSPNFQIADCFVSMVAGDYIEVFADSTVDTSYDISTLLSSVVVARFPTSSEQALSVSNPYYPTVQKFTSGSGTYTTPAGVKYLKVKVIGGGGGGGPSGTSGGSAGTAGNNSTFGTSLLTANGGAAGGGLSTQAGGSGGSYTINSPAIGSGYVGGSGGGGSNSAASGSSLPSGSGGNTCVGGGGAGTYETTGGNGATNTGGGGGGGGGGSSSTTYGGVGGGGGGCIEAIIPNPSATYSYAVGASAAGGGAGASGFSGGNGAGGYIEVTEYYDSGNAPLLVGSVTSANSGALKIESAVVVPSGTCTISSSSSSWITVNTSHATGDCSVNIIGFSSAPTCTATALAATNTARVSAQLYSISSSVLRFVQLSGNTPTLDNNAVHIICIGSR
jgi:hypothetical protein